MIDQSVIKIIAFDSEQPGRTTNAELCRYVRWLLEERRQTGDTMDNMAENLIAEEKECSELRKARDAAHHVLVRHGVVPGMDGTCRCDECRLVADGMANAGYLFTVKDRWWEKPNVLQP